VYFVFVLLCLQPSAALTVRGRGTSRESDDHCAV